MPEELLDWFDGLARDLPWRATREPWAILVAELMLQQTQVSRVIERWPRFLERFPDPTACAGAPVADLIDEWSGLGYNRRAVNLHRAAKTIASDHGGQVPTELGELLALPGIGPYTARAIRVFAFETDDAVVDTNVARILARTLNRTLKPAEAQREADQRVPSNDGWRWNQAMLDLGARHCSSKPDCVGCPLTDRCAWFGAGHPEPDPAIGSAAVSAKQSTFAGSDREGRGRLVRQLRTGPVHASAVNEVLGWPDDPDRCRRVIERLTSDGLIEVDEKRISLPSAG